MAGSVFRKILGRETTADSRATYNTYRQAGKELTGGIVAASLRREALTRAAQLLGIAQRGVLVFDSEEQMPVLFDFALHDVRTGGQNAIALYRATNEPATAVEKDLLAGLAAASTSLFRVSAIAQANKTLLLHDLLVERDDVTLTDVNLSRTALPGLLLFVRIVPLPGLNTTSGFMFVFPADVEGRLLADYKRAVKKTKAVGEAQGRFVHFFRAYQAHGLEVRYG